MKLRKNRCYVSLIIIPVCVYFWGQEAEISENREESRMLTEIRKRMKIVKTCNLYLSLFTLGAAVSLTGPCLLDLQHMVHTDPQHIAMVYTARSIGDLLGSIIGGVLFDFIRSKQAVLMVCNLFVTLTMFGIPWCRNVGILMAFMCINGLSLGAIETGGNIVCLELWGKDSNPIFQGLHFTFSLGGFLSPLIAAPFLENIQESSHNMDNATYLEDEWVNSAANFSKFSNNITHFPEDIPKIIYPFSIVGAVTLLVTLLNLGVCIISPTEDENTKDTSKIDTSERGLLFMFFTFIVTFVIFFVVAGSGIAYAQTLTLFSVKGPLHLTAARGSYITSAFWAAFAIARLSSVFLSMKISCLKLIIGDICLVAIAALILLFLMPNEWALWLASVTFGTGIASAYAALVGWINTHVIITNKFSAVFTVGCASGEMIAPFVIVYFIDTIPEMFSFMTASSVILTTIFLFILHCMFKSGSRNNGSKSVDCYVIDEVETNN